MSCSGDRTLRKHGESPNRMSSCTSCPSKLAHIFWLKKVGASQVERLTELFNFCGLLRYLSHGCGVED